MSFSIFFLTHERVSGEKNLQEINETRTFLSLVALSPQNHSCALKEKRKKKNDVLESHRDQRQTAGKVLIL